MADKKKEKKLGDYIVVELAKDSDGKSVAVEFNRENFTPDQWENLKKNAVAAGTLVDQDPKAADAKAAAKLSEQQSKEPAVAPASGDDQERIKRMGQKIEKASAPNDKDLDDLEVERADAGGGGGGTPMARMARMVRESAAGALPADGLEKTAADISKVSNDAVDSAKLPPSPKPAQKGPVGALAAAIQDDANKPAATGPVDGISRFDETQQSPVIQQALKNAQTRPTMRLPDNPLDRAEASALAPPPEPSMLQRIAGDGSPFDVLGKGLKSGVDAVSRVLTPSEAPNEQQLAAREDLPPSSAAPTQIGAPAPVVAPPPGVGTPPPAPGGSLSVGVKTQTPGSAAGVAPPVNYDEERALMEKAHALERDSINNKAGIESEREKKNAAILDEKIQFTADNEKKRLAAVNTFDETLNRGQQALNSIADERRALMNQSIDPDAYYTKGGVGRAILNTISGTLFGFTGQGQQFLDRLDNLAQQEVKNQQDELARRSGELSLLAQDKKNVIAMAREQGMNAMESLAAARVSFYQNVQDQLAKVAAENPTLMAAAQEKMAQLDGKFATELANFKQLNQMSAHQNVQDRVAMMNANTNRMEAHAKIAAANEKAGKGVPMKPAEKKTMADYLTMGDTLTQMAKEYRDARGNSFALTGAVSKELGVGGTTKSSRWDKRMDNFTQLIGKPLEGGVVREEDTKRYKGSYIPDVSDSDELAEQKMKGLLDYATSQYANTYNGHVATNAEGIENYPSPQVYRQFLQEKMFGKAVPSEKPYGKK